MGRMGCLRIFIKNNVMFLAKSLNNHYLCRCNGHYYGFVEIAFTCVCHSIRKRVNGKLNFSFMKVLSTNDAPAAIGPYSQAIEANGLVYTSGQLPIYPKTGAFPEGGIKEQTRQSIENAKAILCSAGLSLANVVKTTVLLADIADFGSMNEVYAEYFSEPYPARSAFAVRALPKGALVEIEMVAAR